jgi:hypothetical protein
MSKLSTFIHAHAQATLDIAAVLKVLLGATPLDPVGKAVLNDLLNGAISTAENTKAAALAEGVEPLPAAAHPTLTPLASPAPVAGDPFAALRK